MTTSLKDWREETLDAILTFLWRQWSALGVPGYGGDAVVRVVDPEATLALTCAFGRYDPRLFDEAVNWLLLYERFINVQRLHTLFRKEVFSGGAALAATAATLQAHKRLPRWRPFRKFAAHPDAPQPFFLARDGAPLPESAHRDKTFLRAGWVRDPFQRRAHGTLRVQGAGALLLRMRALLGVNARCEILLYLMCNTTGYPSEIAAETYYAQKTIHDALKDMALSGYISAMRKRRERLCRINGAHLPQALLGDMPPPPWLNWPEILGAVETAWRALDTLASMNADPELERSGAHALADTLVSALFKRNIPNIASPDPRSLEGCLQPLRDVLEFIRV